MSSFSKIFKDLSINGLIISPRGQKTLELENYLAVFEPYERFANFPSRKLSLNYIKAELLWYLKGDPQDLSICDKAKLWREMVTDGQLNSNYGSYVFKNGQLDYVVECLLKDPSSRRAIISILGKEHLYLENKDVPCTVSLGFMIRNGELKCTVIMRSCDAIYGMSNDIPFFSFVQECVLVCLNDSLKDKLLLGQLDLFVQSLHVYDRHWPMLHKLLVEDLVPIWCPKLSSRSELDALRNGLKPVTIGIGNRFTEWLYSPDLVIETRP